MNLHWQRTYTEGNIEKVADTGAIYTPPTMFAIEGKVNVELQELVTSWNGYMGMNTAFTRSSKIQCLHLDRYASGSGDDPGAAIQLDWNLNIPETVLLPIKSPQEPEQIFMEYRVVGGIIHRGRDNEGHVQAVCRNLHGWLVFGDGREPVQCGLQPPFPNDRVCVWLLQFSWALLRNPTSWMQGIDHITTRAAVEFSKHVWRLDQYPKDLLSHMMAHCLVCGRTVLSFTGLQAHGM